MGLGQRSANLISWLKRSDLRSWRIKRHACLNCGGKLAFTMGGPPHLSRCLSCGLTGTALALLPVLRDHIDERGLETGIAWEMSTHGPVKPFLEARGLQVIETEFLDDVPSGEVRNGIRCEDVTNSSFTADSLELITCNQVFEHVEHDLAGYAECHRILRPGGALVFAVPLGGAQATKQVASTQTGQLVFHGRPEFHSDRLRGPNSVPVYWHFSTLDLLDRVASVGFKTSWREVPFIPGSPHVTRVVYAVKESAS